MITLNITAEDPASLRMQLAELLSGSHITVEPLIEEKAPGKPRATASKKTSTATDTSATAAQPKAADPAPAVTTSSDETGSDVDLTPAAVKARAMTFSQKFGPSKLIDTQKAAGAPDGKWSQIEGDPERVAAISNLLQAEGF